MKKTVSDFLNNRTSMLIFSLLAALVFWFVVVFSISPESTRVISDVPVTYGDGMSYKSLGIDIIDKTAYKVDVRVKGSRSVIGALTTEDISVVPNFSGVSQVGVYELPLTASKTNTTKTFTITEITEPTLTLRFDQSESRKFTLESVVEGLEVADGYVAGTYTVSPTEVTISGAEAQVNEIARAIVRYDAGAELSSTVVATCDILLLDAGGNELSTESLLMDYSTAELTIPILKQGMLKLDIGFLNVPKSFDITTLDYRMSVNEIRVAGPEASVDKLTTKTVGYLDLASFALGESYVFDVQLSNGFVNIDNVTTVTATFPQDALASKKVRVTNISVENAPSDYDIVVDTAMINDVTVIGPKQDVDALLAGSVVAIADVSQITVAKGDYNIPVRFVIPSSSTVFVAGNYSVTLTITTGQEEN